MPRGHSSGGPAEPFGAADPHDRLGRPAPPRAAASPPASILVADHRGAGLAPHLACLASARLAHRAVAWTVTGSVAATRDALADEAFTIAVLDALAAGGRAELELVAEVAGSSERGVLLVVEPGTPPPAAAMRALAGVAWDLVHRDAPVEEYAMRLERLLDVVAERQEFARVRYEAHHDAPTGLLRPAPFQQRLREHFSAAQRHGLALALVIVDLDRFGRVNKEFDHTIGDELIARVGAVIQRCLRAEDVGARIGGDEFAVVLPYTQPVDAARVVQRLLEQIHALSGPAPASPGEGGRFPGPLRVSGSIGFETFDGRDLESPEVLRRHAESSLREAKLRGGNMAVYYRSLAQGAPGLGAAGAGPERRSVGFGSAAPSRASDAPTTHFGALAHALDPGGSAAAHQDRA